MAKYKLEMERINDGYLVITVNGIELMVHADEDGVSAEFSTGEIASHDWEEKA